jgi:hypothetical protein
MKKLNFWHIMHFSVLSSSCCSSYKSSLENNLKFCPNNISGGLATTEICGFWKNPCIQGYF